MGHTKLVQLDSAKPSLVQSVRRLITLPQCTQTGGPYHPPPAWGAVISGRCQTSSCLVGHRPLFIWGYGVGFNINLIIEFVLVTQSDRFVSRKLYLVKSNLE